MLRSKRPADPSGTTPPFQLLASAVRRAGRSGELTSELDLAILECAREARRRSELPEVFLVRMKSCVGSALPALATPERGALLSRTVLQAIRAYYGRV